MKYIWENPNWPNFTYDLGGLQNTVYLYAKEAAEISGGFQQIHKQNQSEALLDIIMSEAIKTSEIEGEYYTQDDIRSSLRNHLGLSQTTEKVGDKRANSISRLMVFSRKTFEQPLTEKTLFEWHKMLMESHPHEEKMCIGRWRESLEPMQIISGAYGHETIHYEAPPSTSVPKEMIHFLKWFNETTPSTEKLSLAGPIRAAIAHIHFECIHPFEDGNGRIGRAISEKALSQDLGRPILLSLSSEIMKDKNTYYDQLSKASIGDLDITEWLTYFTNTIYNAQLSTKTLISFVLFKSKFWRDHSGLLNDRQEKVLHRMFKEGPKGFEGGISAKKYMKLTGTSKATATRDLTDLYKRGCLIKLTSGGRSTHYDLPRPA